MDAKALALLERHKGKRKPHYVALMSRDLPHREAALYLEVGTFEYGEDICGYVRLLVGTAAEVRREETKWRRYLKKEWSEHYVIQ